MEVCSRLAKQLLRTICHRIRARPKISMSSHESEQVLTLLKELSLLKELDSGYEAGPKTEAERGAHRLRQQRHQEIAEEIKALADQKKNDAEQSPLSDHA
jgi:hypothetical protein